NGGFRCSPVVNLFERLDGRGSAVGFLQSGRWKIDGEYPRAAQIGVAVGRTKGGGGRLGGRAVVLCKPVCGGQQERRRCASRSVVHCLVLLPSSFTESPRAVARSPVPANSHPQT